MNQNSLNASFTCLLGNCVIRAISSNFITSTANQTVGLMLEEDPPDLFFSNLGHAFILCDVASQYLHLFTHLQFLLLQPPLLNSLQ